MRRKQGKVYKFAEGGPTGVLDEKSKQQVAAVTAQALQTMQKMGAGRGGAPGGAPPGLPPQGMAPQGPAAGGMPPGMPPQGMPPGAGRPPPPQGGMPPGGMPLQRPPGMAKGGSIDGCASRGKTKAKRY